MEGIKSRIHGLPPLPKCLSFRHRRPQKVAGPLPPLQQPSPISSARSLPRERPQVDRAVVSRESSKAASLPSPQSPPQLEPTNAPFLAPAIAHSIAPALVPLFPFIHEHRQPVNHRASVPARHQHMGIGIPMIPDPRFGTDKIVGLNLYNFNNFTTGKEKALVLFYNPQTTSGCGLKQEFELAAETYQDKNRAFGAVDCLLDKELCCREKICTTPMFKLYSNGFPVSSISETSRFKAYQMHMLIKMTPVFSQPRHVLTKQPARPRVIMGTRMLKRYQNGI